MAASGQSLMPEGMEKDLTPQELADLVAYLNSKVEEEEERVVARERTTRKRLGLTRLGDGEEGV